MILLVKLLASIVIGLLLVPLGLLLWFPVIAIQALYDEEAYRSALWKRVEDTARILWFLGRSVGAAIP